MRATIRCWHLHDQGAGTAPPTRPDHLDSGKEAMEPHIDVITLAVGDLDRALAFYRDGLGLETPGVTGNQFVGDEANAAGAVVMSTSEVASCLRSTRAAN